MDTDKETSPQEVAARTVGTGESEVAIFEFEGQLRDLMVAKLKDAYLVSGNYLPDAKAVSERGAISLGMVGAAAGASALSAGFSGTLFMATANPATLMSIKGGA